VFVDESGDLGFSEAATKYFIVAYVECEEPAKLRLSSSQAAFSQLITAES
jgi:hypothetical protein